MGTLFEVSSLWRVTSASLDHQKNWYILTEKVCGTRPTDFAKSKIFRSFPDEIQSVSARELLPAKSTSYTSKFNRVPSTVYVASTFGLCAGLLHRKEFPLDGLVCSPLFKCAVNALNSLALDFDRSKLDDFGSGGNFDPSQLLAELEDRKHFIDSLELELKSLQARIGDLESKLYMDTSCDSTSSSESSPSYCSSPISDHVSSSSPSSSPSSCGSFIEETKNSPDCGKTTKKRRVLSKCKEVMASLDGVSEKYGESIACVLGNSFIFGGEAEQGQVRDLVSEVVDIVMDSKGKRGFSELLSSETHTRVLRSMRVPDWVLLYFKLQSKLPDSAWQTLLNLSQLGRSGVSVIIISMIIFLFTCLIIIIIYIELESAC